MFLFDYADIYEKVIDHNVNLSDQKLFKLDIFSFLLLCVYKTYDIISIFQNKTKKIQCYLAFSFDYFIFML